MPLWKPVDIDGVSPELLEGLNGIEECTNYEGSIFQSNTSEIHQRNKHKTKSKRKTGKAPQHSPEKRRKDEQVELTPSRQGSTFTDSFTKQNFEDDVNLEDVKLWTNLPLQTPLLRAIENLKYTQPTVIQSLTLPAAILGRRDILGAAETGSGKTLAFCLPIVYGILKLKDAKLEGEKPLYGLILTPTRELAIQVKQHLDNLARHTGVISALVIGGMAVEKQLRLLNKGPEIVVGTPGRLWELLEEGNRHLSRVNSIRFLAIDETDRMLEKGHFQELLKILEVINSDEAKIKTRQNFVFSATLTLIHELPKHVLMKNKIRFKRKAANMTAAEKVKKIIDTLNMKNPKVVDITEKKVTPSTLTECKITCDILEKDYYVYYFLVKHPGKTLIFCNSIGCVQRLAKILALLDCNALALHASLQQRQRLKNLDRFKDGENCVLIATDVAARGLDISSISHVIHYQVPTTSESYVHRSGRTARASTEGITILLVTETELNQYLRLCRTLGRTEDFPIFPVERDLLTAVKTRVNLARELDTLELRARKANVNAGWIQKAAQEMDIIVDDDMGFKQDEEESGGYKSAAEKKRKQLKRMLEKPIISRSLTAKYLGDLAQLKDARQPDDIRSNAIETMKNVIKEKSEKRSIKRKHLFKSKISTTVSVSNGEKGGSKKPQRKTSRR